MPAPVLPGQPGTGGSNTPWGLVPQVPDPIATANAAITGDIANFPQLSQLANQVNTFNTQQAIAPYIANLPGYSQMVEQSSANIGNLLQGQIPQDVLNLIGQQAAERGVNQGIAGSPNQNAEMLRALGLTSLGLQQQGEGELTAAIGRTPVPQLFNTAQFLTTPGDEQAAQMAANIYAAAPNPGMQAQALIDLFTKFMSQLGQGGRGPSLVTPGGGFGQGSYSAGGPTPGATGGGGGGPATGRPGLSLNTGAIFGNQPTQAPFQGPAINYGTGGASGGFQGPAIDPWTGAFSGGFQGPAIDPFTGAASGGFQGPAIDPWSGAFSGGYQGPAIDPFSGAASGGFQGPSIDPWSGVASGGFQGPAINPWTGESTLPPPPAPSEPIPSWAALPGEDVGSFYDFSGP